MGAGVAQSVVSDYRLDDQGSNVEVKNESELYLLCRLAPAWRNGTALLFSLTSIRTFIEHRSLVVNILASYLRASKFKSLPETSCTY
jgi:hypothetical protein